MRLVRQVTLHLVSERGLARLLEIDLVETATARFVVSFRAGRPGVVPGDYTRTPVSVDEQRARELFEALLAEKEAEGYVIVDRYEAGAEPEPRGQPLLPSAGTPDAPGRRRAVLESLQEAAGGKGHRSLTRLVWRAGEMGLVEAAPLLLDMLGRAPPARPAPAAGLFRRRRAEATAPEAADPGASLLRYSLVWALARVGDPRAAAALAALYIDERDRIARGDERSPAGRLAGYAFLELATGELRRTTLAAMVEELPAGLRDPLARKDPEGLKRALRRALAGAAKDAVAEDAGAQDPARRAEARGVYRAVDVLYLVAGGPAGDETARPALLDFVSETSLAPPAFQRLRHLLKAAELRRDWELFGLLAWRFEKTRALFHRSGWAGQRHLLGGRSVPIHDELESPEARLAYSDRTRRYLRRRTWRLLRRLGERGDDEYVRAAVGVLLPFTDDDAGPVKVSSRQVWGPGGFADVRTVVTEYDRFAPYLAFNHVLYGQSPRYERPAHVATWRCRPPYRPGEPAPDVREEAFPALWEAQPRGLLHLLTASRCTPVLEHAARALRALPEVMTDLDDEVVAALLRAPHSLPASLGLEIARLRLGRAAAAPSEALVLGLLLAYLEEGRLAVEPFLGTLDAETQRHVVAQLAAELLALGAGEARDAASSAVALVGRYLGPALTSIGGPALLDLLAADAEAAQLLAVAGMLARDDADLALLPLRLLTLPLGSSYADVRARGVAVLEKLPVSVVADRLALLRDLVESPHPEVRRAAGPLVARLATEREDVGADLAILLVAALLRPPRGDDVSLHSDVLALLKGPLLRFLATLSPEQVWHLLESRQKAAQDLGGELLKTQVDAETVSVPRLARLLDHDVLSVREAARLLAERSLPRVLADLDDAVRFLDVDWEDSRQWAMDLFAAHLDEGALTPRVLVALADSTRPDVERFGLALIGRFVTDESGPDLLEKLAEHPSPLVQRQAAEWLERFAQGDGARLTRLEPFFVVALSQVNRGAHAKALVHRYLAERAQESRTGAEVAARVLGRISATLAVTERARAIETLTDIGLRWPDLEVTPLKVVAAPPAVAPPPPAPSGGALGTTLPEVT